jgi:hypothetical protein
VNLSCGLDRSTRIVASSQQVSSALAGESVILNLQSGTYYGLNEVGSSIWQRIQHPITILNLCDEITSEFDVDSNICEVEVLRLVAEMIDAQLVEICVEKEMSVQ